MHESRRLQIEYWAANEDEFSHRDDRALRALQRPGGLVRRRVDPAKEDVLRQFRLDRIKSAELLEETFERREDLDPVADVGGWPRTGKVEGSRDRARLDLARAGPLGAARSARCWPSCPTAR